MFTHQLRNPHLRIALYSHDTQGLGHIRRNLAIAGALANGLPEPAILLLSGTHIAGTFDLPPGTDCLTLPALGKGADGNYAARTLGVPLRHLLKLRGAMIEAALTAFAPDLLIVDKVPYGALDELKGALQALRTLGKTRCVLGLRDVLDDPATTRREWRQAQSDEAVRRYYDAVWVYGDPTVYDAVHEYGFADDICAKVAYTGYLNRYGQPQPATVPLPAELCGEHEPLALCAVGGGQDGYAVAHAFAQAELPAAMTGVILTGPFMPQSQREVLTACAAQRPRLKVLDFAAEPGALLQRADTIVAMGGYNTTCEILSLQKRALLVPRVSPRLEQWIRAERLQALGLLDMVHPDQLTPHHLSAWLAQRQPAPARPRHPVDLDGLNRLPNLALHLLAAPRLRSKTMPRPFMLENAHANKQPNSARRLHPQNVPALL